MSCAAALTVSERIARPVPEWNDPGVLLREHSTLLAELLQTVPAAQTTAQAYARTLGLWQWLNFSGMELCHLMADANDDATPPLTGICFGDSPYGTHRAPAGVGRLYLDPLLAGRVMDSGMVDNGPALTRDNPEAMAWYEQAVAVERQWYAQSDHAPVIVIEVSTVPNQFSLPSYGLGPAETTITVDATNAILALSPMERRRLSGRHSGVPFPLQHSDIPAALTAIDTPFNLEVHYHIPSAALMAARRADRLDRGTAAAAGNNAITRL